MRKAKMAAGRGQKKPNNRVGSFERLEDRELLTPLPALGTQFRVAIGTTGGAAAIDTFSNNGFLSVRLISTQAGRIEADTTGAFGGDLFVISRGTVVGSGGIIPTPINADDASGTIYRVDPYAVDGFGMSPSENRIRFGTIPSGGVSFGGYEDWYDLAFDPTDSFTGVNGGATLYVSTLDSSTTAGVNPKNAIYAFRPDGSLATPASPSNPDRVAMFSTRDVIHPGILDSQIGSLAIAPGDTFGRNLYLIDVACDNETGITCAAGDGNTIFGVSPIQVTQALGNPAQTAINLEEPTLPLNRHLEGVLPPLTPVAANNDIDARAMAFDPNRGIILQGRNGEPAFPLYGGLFVASSDIEAADTGQSRVLHFPSLGFPPIDLITPATVQTRMIGDMAFDPVGHFGGGLFFTDYITRSVFQIIQNPTTGLGTIIGPVISNFNVLTPTQFLPTDPPGITPADAYRDAFSISFSPDGQIMFVSDRDGVWAFYAGTLAKSAAGSALGLNDVRELHVPYTGQGFASAVVDTGIDAAHLGFQGTVSAGFNPAFPSTAAFDACPAVTQGEPCHGTATAGIIHQIVPDAVLVPVNPLGFITTGFGTNQDFWEAISFIADHPFVDDPRTPGIDESVDNPATPQDDRTKIVSVNMSLGVQPTTSTDSIHGTEREAFESALSATITFKNVFERYRALGIVPVGAAGNAATTAAGGAAAGNVQGMNGAIIPGILNGVVQVTAAYPFGVSPLLPAPPITVTATAAAGTRCTLGAGDLIAFPGKIPGFANRSVTTDFAAPGLCVPSFARSLFLTGTTPAAQAVSLAPLLQNFMGTSAAAPIVAGSFVFGFDTVAHWLAVVAAGGAISPINSAATTTDDKIAALNQYLVRGQLGTTGFQVAPSTLAIGTAASHLAQYMSQDGINAILQWSAIPREDVNIGESVNVPNGTDDAVAQRRLLRGAKYRTYAHLHLGNFLSSVEGSIALNFFSTRPTELAELASSAGTPGLITPQDIDCYVAAGSPAADPLVCIGGSINTASERAMAQLLGGSDRIARLNRVTYLDLVQDQRVDGGILIDAVSYAALRTRILPRPTDFVIVNRHNAANRTFAIDSTAARNYHDLNYIPRSSSLAPRGSKKLRRRSPDQLLTGGRVFPLSFGDAGGISADQLNGGERHTATIATTGHRARHAELVDTALAGALRDVIFSIRGLD